MQTNLIGTTKSLPVSALVVSPRNVRRTGGQSIESLAASIKAHGLIQNLSVIPVNGKYEVITGGRRCRALQRLIKLKELPKDHKVECKIVAPDTAEEVSLSENVNREAMHPADQFDGFKALADKGMPVEDIAARFGVAPMVVKQRLKLANVSPKLVEQFRKDKVTLEQMMALAVTDDHTAQERVWNAARDWQREPRELRAALTETDVDAKRDRRALYIGIAAYEKAGGVVRRDLFSEGVYLTDVELLDRLTEEKLQRAVARLQKEGWGWFEYRVQCDYSELHAFGRLAQKLREPTKKERAALESLDKAQEALEQEYNDDLTDAQQAKLDAAFDRIEAKRAQIEEARRVEDVDAKAKAGALVFVAQDGSAQIERGLIRPEDRKARREQAEKTASDSPKTEKKKAEFSDALTRRLTAERTLALRATFAAQPEQALTALVHALVLAEFFASSMTALDLSIRDQAHLNRSGVKLDETKAGQALHVLRNELQSSLPSDAADVWAWAMEQDQATLLKYLAYCLAPAVNAMQDRASDVRTHTGRPMAAVQSLASLLKLDMANWWQATPESYFAGVSKAKLVEAVCEAKGTEAAARIEKMNKGDAVSAASAALDGTRWLPSLLR